MPLRASQIFFRAGSLEELGEALGRSLQQLPRAEREVLALFEESWAALVCERAEPLLAKHLSERFGTALLLDLDGGALALSVQTWEAGQPQDVEQDPKPPRFRDVEDAAWKLLDYLGVPPALRLVPLRAVRILPGPRGGMLSVLAKTTVSNIEMWTVQALPPPRSSELPVEPDVVVESAAGESRALEVRQLPSGVPSAAWAGALAAVEEQQAARLLKKLALDEDFPSRVPRPTFVYRSLQSLRLEKLLLAARRERPWLWRVLDPEQPPPFSQAGFTAFCRARMPAELRVVRAHGAHLELLRGEACVRAPLFFQEYLASLDEEAVLGRVTQAARSAAAPPPVSEWPSALEHLLPTLTAAPAAGRAELEAAPGLWGALLADDGRAIAPVLASDLDALGLSLEDAFVRALQNADGLMHAAPEAVRYFDLEHGRVVVCDFPDPAGAGRLLSPEARALLVEVLGCKEGLCAAPTRDSLLACDAADAEGTRWLAEEALTRFDEGPFPISPALWHITADDFWPK